MAVLWLHTLAEDGERGRCLSRHTGFVRPVRDENQVGFCTYLILFNGPLSGEKFLVLRACTPAL
jgi:hypothetical protein